jgi:hypothetical protein
MHDELEQEICLLTYAFAAFSLFYIFTDYVLEHVRLREGLLPLLVRSIGSGWTFEESVLLCSDRHLSR